MNWNEARKSPLYQTQQSFRDMVDAQLAAEEREQQRTDRERQQTEKAIKSGFMTSQDYTSMIVIGFCENREFLSDYFYREYKNKGEVNFISPLEFFTNLKKACEVLVSEVKRHYYARVNEIAMIKDLRQSEGKSTDDLEGQVGDIYNYSTNCAGGIYMATLWYRDLVYVQEEITKAEKQIQSEIDWIKIFQDLDIEKEIPVKAYNISSLKQKEKYFSEATFKLTLDYLLDLKKEIYFLSPKNKLAHLNSKNIPPPKLTHSGNELFDQTCFEAQRNYYDFLESYKKFLQDTLHEFNPEIKMAEVFISYSWDSKEHNEKVLSFTNHLRENGFEAQLDRMLSQSESAPNFVKMMHKAMREHLKVIVVLSHGYKTKAETFTGGVGEEYSILLNDISNNPTKYILVSFEGRGDEITPLGLKGRDIVDLSKQGEEERLFRKLLNEKEFEFSPVAPKKPEIGPQAIPEYRSPLDQKSTIDILGFNFKAGPKSLSGGLYRTIEFTLAFDFKNSSNRVVDGFAYEVRLIKFLDPEYYRATTQGDIIVYSESVSDKIYPNQTKRSKDYKLKVWNGNVWKVAASSIVVKVFTDSGFSEKEYQTKDIIKIHPGGYDYNQEVPVAPELFI